MILRSSRNTTTRKSTHQAAPLLRLPNKSTKYFSGDKEYVYGRTQGARKKAAKKKSVSTQCAAERLSGEHDVLFLGNDEIIEVHHRALSRQVFAEGAVRAAQFLIGNPAGLYSMEDIISAKIVSSIYVEEENNAHVTSSICRTILSYIADVFDHIAKNSVNIATISQAYPQDGTVDITFSVASLDLETVRAALDEVVFLISAFPISQSSPLEGDGMLGSMAWYPSCFSALAANRIKTYIVTDSETRISFCRKNQGRNQGDQGCHTGVRPVISTNRGNHKLKKV